MAYTTIDNPELFFQVKTYTGTGSAVSITLDGSEDMQPDWVWIKNRGNSARHMLYDVIRGVQETLFSDLTNAETAGAGHLTAFNSDGFSLGDNSGTGSSNGSSETYVAWCWKAGGSASSNSNGSITSSVSASSTSGFSIATYTGNGTDNATFGHGLSSAPEMVWLKQRNSTGNWRVGATPMDSSFDEVMNLNLSNAKASASTIFSAVAPNSTVVTLGTESDANGSSNTFVAYSFHSVQGYSKISKYTGNGSSDGPFIYCGFKPAWVIVKRLAGVNQGWYMWDNKRNGFNRRNYNLEANDDAAEDDGNERINLLSTGFKWIVNDTIVNNSGTEYLFMAFAESPIVNSNGVPNNAE